MNTFDRFGKQWGNIQDFELFTHSARRQTEWWDAIGNYHLFQCRYSQVFIGVAGK